MKIIPAIALHQVQHPPCTKKGRTHQPASSLVTRDLQNPLANSRKDNQNSKDHTSNNHSWFGLLFSSSSDLFLFSFSSSLLPPLFTKKDRTLFHRWASILSQNLLAFLQTADLRLFPDFGAKKTPASTPAAPRTLPSRIPSFTPLMSRPHFMSGPSLLFLRLIQLEVSDGIGWCQAGRGRKRQVNFHSKS